MAPTLSLSTMGCGASTPTADTSKAQAEEVQAQAPEAKAAPQAAETAEAEAQAAPQADPQAAAAPEGKIDWAVLNAKLPYQKTEEQKKLRMQMFNEIDLNHSNKLSLGEVSAAMEKILEEAGQVMKVPDVIRMAFNVAKVAAQNAGMKGSEDYVEKREFRLLLKYTREYFELYQLFSQMGEKAGDKRVNLEEFKTAVPLLKEWGVDIEDPEETFKAIDKDKGGQILFDEFANWAMKENLDSPDDDEPEAETAPTDSATVPTAPAEPSAEAEPAEPLAAENAEPAEAPAA